ncbi:hypothetical protein GBF38_006113, partial [Nibea albiflora]
SLIRDLHANEKQKHNKITSKLTSGTAKCRAYLAVYRVDAHGKCPITERLSALPSNQSDVGTLWAGPERLRRGTLR